MKKESKKIVIIGLLVLLTTVILVKVYLSFSKKKQATLSTPTPTKPSIQNNYNYIKTTDKPKPDSSKIKINNIEIANFYKKSLNTKEDGFAEIERKKEYQIMYIPVDNSFLISITGSSFEDIKKQAEEEILKILEIDKKDACKLNINITTPRYANPEFAGKIYKPSFCENYQ